MSEVYVLKKPLLDFKRGERLTYDSDWNEWTRKATGVSYDCRGTIGKGEVVLLLNAAKQLPTILEPITKEKI